MQRTGALPEGPVRAAQRTGARCRTCSGRAENWRALPDLFGPCRELARAAGGTCSGLAENWRALSQRPFGPCRMLTCDDFSELTRSGASEVVRVWVLVEPRQRAHRLGAERRIGVRRTLESFICRNGFWRRLCASENPMLGYLCDRGSRSWAGLGAWVEVAGEAGLGARATGAFFGDVAGRTGGRTGSSGASRRAPRARVCDGRGVCSRAV